MVGLPAFTYADPTYTPASVTAPSYHDGYPIDNVDTSYGFGSKPGVSDYGYDRYPIDHFGPTDFRGYY